jgi:predicted metal-dependent peptidase
MVKLQRNAGIFLPSSSTTQLPKLLIAVDTSGSIGKGVLSRITGEIAACADEAASKEPETIKIIWFDSNIAGEEFYEHGKTLSPKGGGGTNYAPVMEYANSEEGGGYNGLIIITDGYCNKFGTEPPMACLWILTRKNDSFKPPFGEVIRFSE